MLRVPTPLLTAAVSLAAVLTGCGDAPDGQQGAPATTSQAAQRRVDGTIHLLQFNRLQGMTDGIPCVDDPVPVLAAATELRDELRAEGDQAYVICAGDTLTAVKFASPRRIDTLAARAEMGVVMDALGRAGVDVLVPGALDLGFGVSDVLDAAQAAGVRVLATNGTDTSGEERLMRSWLPEPSSPDAPRVAFLGAVPVRAASIDRSTKRLDDDEVELDSVVDAIAAEAARIRAEEDVDFVVVGSSLAQPSNSRILDLDEVDLVLGMRDGSAEVRELAFRSGSALAIAGALGREVGHTTIAVVDDDLGLSDVSERHGLAERVARERRWIAPLVDRHGTDDLEELARRVEADPVVGASFAERIRILAEDIEGLALMDAYDSSRIDHRAADLPDVPADHPALVDPGDFARRFDAAIETADLAPPTRTLEHPRVPHPDSCFSCHREQYTFWQATPHAEAFEPLVERRRQHDPSCHECHSTAFGIQGGYDDVRLGNALGGVSCFACHDGVSSLHTLNARRALEPTYTWSIRHEQDCERCHTDLRSPDFDRAAVLDSVACPPMDLRAPDLVRTRAEAQDIIEERFVEGEANDADRFFLARARVASGLDDAVDEFAALAEENRDSAVLTAQIARLLDRYGHSAAGQQVLADYLAEYPGDEAVNTALMHMLLFPRDETAANPEDAIRRLRFLLPQLTDDGEGGPTFLGLRCYLVDALYMSGRVSDGEETLLDLIARFGENPQIRERVQRWDVAPRLVDLARAAAAEAAEKARNQIPIRTTTEPTPDGR